MEAGFCYTSDQDRAINSILSHLKSGKVMDMLLSGDVGFGKTEVAFEVTMKAMLRVDFKRYFLCLLPYFVLSTTKVYKRD